MNLLGEYGSVAWSAYNDSLEQAPILTKCCTSLIGFTVGDSLAQWSIGTRRHNFLRTARFAIYGFCIHATTCHVLYNLMDQNISPNNPTSARAILAKLFVDQCIFAPISICIFYAVLKTLEGRPHEVRSTLHDKMWPTLKAGYTVWPFANLINFIFIPSQQRVLYLNIIQMAWNVVLCRIASAEKPRLGKRQSDAGVKDHAEPKKQTLRQYLQSMRKPGRHKTESLPLSTGRSDSISRGRPTTHPLPAV